MAERSSFAQRWQEYRPTKAVWLWSCVAAAILTLIAGFTWGGWVTGGTASSMAARAAEDAREQLVASICVNRFVNSPNAAATFAKLKEARSWERDDIIEEGGWITIEALDEQIAGRGRCLCGRNHRDGELAGPHGRAERRRSGAGFRWRLASELDGGNRKMATGRESSRPVVAMTG